MHIYTNIVLIIMLSVAGLFGRTSLSTDSLVVAQPDSAAYDSLPQQKTIEKVDYSLYRNGFRGQTLHFSERSAYEIHRYADHLRYNMTGWTDYFKYDNRYVLFDFFDSALPRYLSESQMLPHQSGVRLDGRMLSDPINNMVNTRNISPDIISIIEQDNSHIHAVAAQPALTDGINLTRFRLRPDEPFTRLKYFEGDFGYTDLDITFARQLRKDLSVELGGFSRDYDKTGLNAANYRAGFYKKFGNRLDYSFWFQKNQTETFIDNLVASDSYLFNNLRHDINNDFVYWLDKKENERWHVQLAYTHDRRKTDAVRDSTLFTRVRHYLYQLNADRNFHVKGWELIASTALAHQIVWGNVFSGIYRDSRFSGRLSVKGPSLFSLNVMPNLGYTHQFGEALQILPGVETLWKTDDLRIRANLYQSVRYPGRIEQSVRTGLITGNYRLHAERLTNTSSEIIYKPSNTLQFQADLLWRKIDNEILFKDNGFINGNTRSFIQYHLETSWLFWKLLFTAGGQVTDAAIAVTPSSSFLLSGVYEDTWLNGAVDITISGGMRWYGESKQIHYHQGIERFYWGEEDRDAYHELFYKLAATVKDIDFFFEMDNALSNDYAFISGYYEYIRRVRFGVNWKMWN